MTCDHSNCKKDADGKCDICKNWYCVDHLTSSGRDVICVNCKK